MFCRDLSSLNIGLANRVRISNCISYSKSQKEVPLDFNKCTIFIGQMMWLGLIVRCPVESMKCFKPNVDAQWCPPGSRCSPCCAGAQSSLFTDAVTCSEMLV